MVEGKSNERKLNFGDSPFIIYQNLAAFLNNEIKKLNSSETKPGDPGLATAFAKKTKNVNEIIQAMNKIDQSISGLPVFKCPEKTKIKTKKLNKSENGKVFACELCDATFENGQGLGGHMSRTHPNSSVKFNKKKETREFREKKRNILYDAKAMLLSKYNLNYNDLSKTAEGKQIIRKTVKENKSEYMNLRKYLKQQANAPNN
jgi:hypothetical protein